MTEETQAYRPRKPVSVSASVHMWADCAIAVSAYADSFKPPLSASGAIHKLLRSHPLINLKDLHS